MYKHWIFISLSSCINAFKKLIRCICFLVCCIQKTYYYILHMKFIKNVVNRHSRDRFSVIIKIVDHIRLEQVTKVKNMCQLLWELQYVLFDYALLFMYIPDREHYKLWKQLIVVFDFVFTLCKMCLSEDNSKRVQTGWPFLLNFILCWNCTMLVYVWTNVKRTDQLSNLCIFESPPMGRTPCMWFICENVWLKN